MSRFHYEIIASDSEFEEMVCDLHNALHSTNTFQLYKSRGSNQYGIDIYSFDLGIVIQCKKKDPSRKEKEVRCELAAELRDCVTKAHGVPFDFKTFIFATTSKKFGDLQDLCIELLKDYPFNIQLLAWTDIEKHIHFYPAVRARYYPHLKAEMRPVRGDKVTRIPVANTIGANTLMKTSIIERFNQLGEAREQRFGKSAWGVMYKNFKIDFKIKKLPWTCIWEWPESAAPAIRAYLDEKNANTIAGRIAAHRASPDYVPSRPQLIAREKEALSYLGLEMSSPEVRDLLNRHFGFTSHTKLSHLQYWLLVMDLERAARERLGE